MQLWVHRVQSERGKHTERQRGRQELHWDRKGGRKRREYKRQAVRGGYGGLWVCSDVGVVCVGVSAV